MPKIAGAESAAPVSSPPAVTTAATTASIDLIIGLVTVRLDAVRPSARVAELAMALQAPFAFKPSLPCAIHSVAGWPSREVKSDADAVSTNREVQLNIRASASATEEFKRIGNEGRCTFSDMLRILIERSGLCPELLR